MWAGGGFRGCCGPPFPHADAENESGRERKRACGELWDYSHPEAVGDVLAELVNVHTAFLTLYREK